MTEFNLAQSNFEVIYDESHNTIPAKNVYEAIERHSLGFGKAEHNGLDWPGLPMDIMAVDIKDSRNPLGRVSFSIVGIPSEDAWGSWEQATIYGSLPGPLRRRVGEWFDREPRIFAGVIKTKFILPGDNSQHKAKTID